MSVLPDKKETILYKMSRVLYDEYKAIRDGKFNPELGKLHQDVISYLKFDVHDVGDDTVVTFMLKREDLSDGGN